MYYQTGLSVFTEARIGRLRRELKLSRSHRRCNRRTFLVLFGALVPVRPDELFRLVLAVATRRKGGLGGGGLWEPPGAHLECCESSFSALGKLHCGRIGGLRVQLQLNATRLTPRRKLAFNSAEL